MRLTLDYMLLFLLELIDNLALRDLYSSLVASGTYLVKKASIL